MLRRLLPLAALSFGAVAAGCVDDEGSQQLMEFIQASTGRPDELPVMTNAELPFRYPAALYAQQVQGNVELRLFIDSTGNVLPESTMVQTPSGYPALDSAAVQGARELRFVPAKKEGQPMAVAIVFPVYFRHPEASALPGDTILQQGVAGQGAATGTPSSAPRPATP